MADQLALPLDATADRLPELPDLRPMLILVGLLFAVVLAWLFLSPLILPAT